MKHILAALALLFGSPAQKEKPAPLAKRCDPYAEHCPACKDCSACKHCHELGGKCSVCFKK